MAGRSTDYKEEYCQRLIDFFEVEYTDYKEQVASQGKAVEVVRSKLTKFPTFEGFCTEIGITTQTMHNWTKQNPQFFDAYKIAKQKQKTFLLQGGLSGQYNSSFAKFVAINCTDMIDKSEVKTENDHNVKGYGLAFDLSDKPKD